MSSSESESDSDFLGDFKKGSFSRPSRHSKHLPGKDGSHITRVIPPPSTVCVIKDIEAQNGDVNAALRCAAKEGRTPAVKALLSLNADINACDLIGNALFYAMKHRHKETAELLLAAKSCVQGSCRLHRTTTLIYAVEHGFKMIVQMLLHKNVDLNETDIWDKTALIKAIEGNRPDIALMLINARADVTIPVNVPPLVAASRRGQRLIVEALLAARADIDTSCDYGNSAVMMAAASKHTAVVNFLAANGADLYKQTRMGKTTLMCLAECGHVAMVETVLAARADVNASDRSGHTTLMSAARSGSNSVSVLSVLIAAKAEVTALDVDGRSPLWHAVKAGDTYATETLLAARADIHASPQGATLLAHAVTHGSLSLVEVLLRAGASTAPYGHSHALGRAAHLGRMDILHRLLREGVEVDAEGEKTPSALVQAIKGGKVNAIEALVAAGADVNRRDTAGLTPLLQAADSPSHLSEATVPLLLRLRADVNVCTSDGFTPLLQAALRRHNATVITTLAEAGADISSACSKGYNALMHAARAGYIENFDALIRAGLAVDARSHEGITALMLCGRSACDVQDGEHRCGAVLRELLAYGPDINARDNNEMTVFMHLLCHRWESMPMILLDAGVDVEVADAEGTTALMQLAREGWDGLLQKLLQKIKEKYE